MAILAPVSGTLTVAASTLAADPGVYLEAVHGAKALATVTGWNRAAETVLT